MRTLFSLALISLSCSFSAQESITYPYNPDGDVDGTIASPDLLDILGVYGGEFSPSEIQIDGVNLLQVIQDLQNQIASIPIIEVNYVESTLAVLQQQIDNLNQQIAENALPDGTASGQLLRWNGTAWIPISPFGCTDSTACNYDNSAIIDDDSCTIDDDCGICGGDNSSCSDECGVPNGDNSSCADECGVPNGDNSTCLDECGVPNGDNSTCLDECGVPNGDNSSCADCAGVANGTSVVDECGVCGGDNSSCSDECGVPNGDNSSCSDECGVPNGDNSTCTDCLGVVNGDGLVSHQGYDYSTVQIGDQCWFSENCRYLPEVSPSIEGSEYFLLYYVYGYEGSDVAAAKATANYETYGVLYNWPAVMSEGICPSGWHIPSDVEWETLEISLGINETCPSTWGTCNIASTPGWRGSPVGDYMKSTSGWNDGGNGSNSSGFNGLPGGRRQDDSQFTSLGDYGHWWSTGSTYNPGEPGYGWRWKRALSSVSGNVGSFYNRLDFGFSARCVRD